MKIAFLNATSSPKKIGPVGLFSPAESEIWPADQTGKLRTGLSTKLLVVLVVLMTVSVLFLGRFFTPCPALGCVPYKLYFSAKSLSAHALGSVGQILFVSVGDPKWVHS